MFRGDASLSKERLLICSDGAFDVDGGVLGTRFGYITSSTFGGDTCSRELCGERRGGSGEASSALAKRLAGGVGCEM